MEVLSPSASVTRYEAPFTHWVYEDLLSPEAMRAINDEWPVQWEKEKGKNQFKWNTNNLPPTAKKVVAALTADRVSELTGIPGLRADPNLFGAGLHCIPPGGFLRMHVDFNVHPNGWHRRVNFLVYLNERWEDEWDGALVLGLDKKTKYMPRGNRAVVFETNDESWHGHPDRLLCPPDVQRRSLALYFYTADPPKAKPHTTVYRK